MALPFLNGKAKNKRDQMLAVDLGTRTTKAVHLERRPEGLALCGYALLDAPIFDKSISVELLGEHLKALSQTLQTKNKSVTLTINVSDAVIRTTDTPKIPVEDLRSVFKLNSRTYLQQDLPGYVFDGHVIASFAQPDPTKPNQVSANLQKQRVLIAGAKQSLIDTLVGGAKHAGLVADFIVPGMIGPVNAFELAMPEIFMGEPVALVDIGFKNSTICILQRGELALSRIVGLGGDRLTTSLSETMNISYAEAEGIKLGMPQEVQSALESVLTPLGRELRASIDFFEHQQDKLVKRVFLSGGSARSQVVIAGLESELMVECKTWDPSAYFRSELPPQQAAELPDLAPQLVVAVGAALAAM